ncbi:MAG: DUF6512 family protein [Candidatus Saccharicenans sp.]|uniref:DUF6512 family protein n=1 Tax=Candidatus Saccharicenans sp. TaxID=2819258 RepID=UPI00404918DF
MNIILKAFIYLIFFSVLHFGYDLTGWPFLKLFCGVNESIFQHLKMAFWAYLLASLVEYPVLKRKKKKYESFWIPRFFSASIVPWTIFLVWYLAPATGGKLSPSYLEIIWALVVSFFSGLAGGLIERTLEEQRLAFCFKVLVIFLVVVSAFLYITFTYNLPWIDMFRAPE